MCHFGIFCNSRDFVKSGRVFNVMLLKDLCGVFVDAPHLARILRPPSVPFKRWRDWQRSEHVVRMIRGGGRRSGHHGVTVCCHHGVTVGSQHGGTVGSQLGPTADPGAGISLSSNFRRHEATIEISIELMKLTKGG